MTTIVGPSFVVPLDVALELAEILQDAADRLRRNGLVLHPDLVELAEDARRVSVADRRRAALAELPGPLPGGRPNKQASCTDAGAGPGNGRMVVTEVADAAGITPRRVRQLAAAGALPGRRTGDGWTFETEEVERWLHDRDRGARAGAPTC